MSTIAREARASLAVMARNFNLVKRYGSWEAVWIFYNVINALTIGLIASLTPAHERSYVLVYLIIGALLWNYLSTLFNEISNSVSWERWEGTIEYSFMAPVHRLTYLLGVCLYGVLYSLLRTLIVLAAVALYFRIDLSHADLPGALLVFVISSLPFIGLGLIAAVLPLMSTERGAQATQVIQGIILLVSGVYYPVSALPLPLRVLGELSPATYCLDGVRQAVLHGASIGHLLPLVLGLLAAGVVLIPLGLWVFALGEAYAMRTGKLKRNG